MHNNPRLHTDDIRRLANLLNAGLENVGITDMKPSANVDGIKFIRREAIARSRPNTQSDQDRIERALSGSFGLRCEKSRDIARQMSRARPELFDNVESVAYLTNEYLTTPEAIGNMLAGFCKSCGLLPGRASAIGSQVATVFNSELGITPSSRGAPQDSAARALDKPHKPDPGLTR